MKNLIIVESAAKAKTISNFLSSDYIIKASVGHIRDLPAKTMGVDVENNFEPNYEVSSDKKKVVTELKKLAKQSDMVWLATDEDREGEAIAWHLSQVLKLNPDKTKRIVFHEITKTAILSALDNPRNVDSHLVDAQQARRILDRLVGFELSPLLWKKVRPALSAGRVQSVAVRLIVERETEIKSFESKASFRILAGFEPKGGEANFRAELNKRFVKIEETRSFLEHSKDAQFSIKKVDTKPAKKSPAPPFTTSTLQQEASRKLGFSVARTMALAQQLYESGFITYMRTDSVNLSELALNMAKEEVTKIYGKAFAKTRVFTTKSKGAQEAHEAIRPTEFSRSTIDGDRPLKKLYELVWKRAIASQMSDAKLEKTTVTIDISERKENFVAKGEVILFKGFLEVYLESKDDESEELKSILPAMEKSDILKLKEMSGRQTFTMQPPRFTEASLVKKLEELGIGRPSTYAPTISTIQRREYVVKKDGEGKERGFIVLKLVDNKVVEEAKTEITGKVKNRLFPTDIGSIVNNFLVTYFADILDYNFTANVEKQFDEIADGKELWKKMIDKFYWPFHEKIDTTTKTAKKFSGQKQLGVDPKTGKNIFVKIGRYGPIAQLGDSDTEEKPQFASLREGQSIEDLTLEEALDLFSFPRTIGTYEDEDMAVAIGRFGPYVKHKGAFFSIGKDNDPSTITADIAIELIEAKRKKDKENTLKVFDDKDNTKILNGRFGPYITRKKKNYKIPKGTEPTSLTLEQCDELIAEAKAKPPRRKKKK